MGDSPPIGLIAGAGGLPAEACSRLRTRGIDVRVFAFEGITAPIQGEDELVWTRLGELARLRDALNTRSIERVLIIGKFDRSLIEDPGGRLAPDTEALALLGKVLDQADANLMAIVADWLSEQGFELARQDELLDAMLATSGRLSRTPASPRSTRDIEVGIAAVRALDPLGPAQAVAVKQGSVIAVESEGTDDLIRRAGELAGAGVSLVKGARRDQDRRLDLPTVGPGTIEALATVEASALAIEAGSTLIVSAEAFYREADLAGISVSGWLRTEGEG